MRCSGYNTRTVNYVSTVYAQGAQKKKKKYIYIYISRYNTNICNLFTKKKTHFTGVGLKKKDPLSYRFNKLPRCTVPKVIDFLPYNMKWSGENVILCGIFHVVSCFPLHFMLYRENLDYFSDSVVGSRRRTVFWNSQLIMGGWWEVTGSGQHNFSTTPLNVRTVATKLNYTWEQAYN